jgi:hypothetical protein
MRLCSVHVFLGVGYIMMSDFLSTTSSSSSATTGSGGTPLAHATAGSTKAGERIIIVGDVHGCINELRALLRKCHYRQGVDRLISVGDLVGKGPDSVAVVRLIRVCLVITPILITCATLRYIPYFNQWLCSCVYMCIVIRW